MADAEAFLFKFVPDGMGMRIRSADVSDPLKYSFYEFCSLIAGSAAVISTRLHAGVMAAMLDIPTALVTGRYGKIADVYNQSLREKSNVHLLPIAIL